MMKLRTVIKKLKTHNKRMNQQYFFLFKQNLNDNQLRLLYIIHLYTKEAENPKLDVWMQGSFLRVILFECICNQVFDYDYGPSLEDVEETRQYLNISYV